MRQKWYIFLLVSIAVWATAQGRRDAATRSIPVGAVERMDSTAPLTVSTPDTIAPLDLPTLDSLQLDTAKFSELDSLKRLFDAQHGIKNDSSLRMGRGIQWNDSVAAAKDSIRATQKKSSLEDPVKYEAKDSIVFFMDTKHAMLYGDAKVDYQNINLTAEQITISMDSSVVHAIGTKDSLEHWQGKPVFTQGSDSYESEEMSYNFETRKGFITNVTTVQQEGFLYSKEAKKGDGDELFMRKGTYTTCDEEHPHFYIALSRAKVHTGKSVFSGPAWLVVEDVPLPLAVPFAYFPFTSSYSSGFIMPSYGDENTRGFYLRDGGYYFAINDNLDLRLTGEIFTKGSWGLSAQTTYKKRYKYHGNFYFNYQVTKTGEENMPDYEEVKNFKLQWSHTQDPKMSPNSSFSASVNFATQSYEKNNLTSLYNPTSYAQSTRTSSVSYSRTFPKLGLSLSSSFNIAQNMRDSTLALTLPNLSVSLQKLYPFKRKKMLGKERWYEKISMSYSGTLSNSISTKEDLLFKSNLIKDWKNGMRHQIPIQASFQVAKYINIVPSFNYTERWYTNRVMQSWDADRKSVLRDTIYGFNRVYNYNLNLSANTKLYVFYKPNPKILGEKIQMVRHVLTPAITFSYAPDFSARRYGYYKTYARTDANGNVSLVEYSPFSGSLYGVPGKGKTGSVSFDLSNNIEMKVKTNNDTVDVKKLSIIDELGASLSYNMAAKQQPWSNLTTRLRLKWGKIALNLNTTWMTYAYQFDENGNVIVGNRTEWSYGRFGRFQGMSKNLSYTFNNQSWKTISKKFRKLFHRGEEEEEEKLEEDESDEEMADDDKKKKKESNDADGLDADGYMKFNLPWSFSISYGITMSEDRSARINVKTMRYPFKFVHNLNFSGNIKLASNWNINFSSGYDFTNHAISMTTVNIARDMHCFNISGGLVLGTFTSYHVTMRANASTLTDALKYDKRSSYSSTINWY